MPSSRGSFQLRDRTQVSCIAGRFFITWTTREAQEYWSGRPILLSGGLPDPGIKPQSPALQVDSLPAEECSYEFTNQSNKTNKYIWGFFSPISFLSSASSTSTGHCLIGQVLLTCGSDITSLPSSIWHHHYPHQAFHSKEERLHLFYSLQREVSGQESLACCSPWACEESDKTEQLNNHREVSTHSFLCPSVSRNS